LRHAALNKINRIVLGGDPHYMIRIRGIEHPICFDVVSKGGEIHNLITDTRNSKYNTYPIN
jgi:hypothetical protein